MGVGKAVSGAWSSMTGWKSTSYVEGGSYKLTSLPTKHFGGLVYAHGGLATDDIPVIARRGEGFLTQTGMANIGGADNLRRLNHGINGTGGINITIINKIEGGLSDDKRTEAIFEKHSKAQARAIVYELQHNNQALRGGLRRWGR